ncbi:MAG: glycosyltransferase [Planctomycetaceae bacterium]|nr:MAG: glycosyltransferase [Planctomycetaceae bacterium]
MQNNLSICIVGKDNSDLLGECIDSCLKLSQNIVYIDLKSMDDSITVAKQKGVTIVQNESSLAGIEKDVKRAVGSDWILFVKPDEKPVLKPNIKLDKILNESSLQGYSLIVKDSMGPEILENYQWMKITEQYKYIKDSAYTSKIEIRLVHHRHLLDILEAMVAGSKKNLFSLKHGHFAEIEIHPCWKEQKEEPIAGDKEQGLKYLKGELSCGPVEEDNLFELEDNSLIYSVLTMNDLVTYHKGLSMGLGGERMYLSMLCYLGQFGRYNEAREFFETWKEQWEFFDTLEPYKIGGIIYANFLDLEKAVLCLEKYIESAPDKTLGEALSALAKVSLLQGRKDKALSLLKRAQSYPLEENFRPIIQIVEKENWKPVKLSVCMIARDEEHNIRKALESIAPMAEEIIVVDTGSTDGTKKIVREFTDIIIDAPWEDDFSKARNLALEKVTGDYVLYLDADEFIDARERINLGLFKQIMPADRNKAYQIRVEPEDKDEEIAVMLRLPKTNEADYQIRLFPANKGIKFSGEAYECVDKSIRNTDIKIERNEQFRIIHSKIDQEKRARRKMSAVRASFSSISESKKALKGFTYFLKLGELDTALSWLEKIEIEDPILLGKIAEYYVSTGKIPAIITELVRKGLKMFPDSIELILSNAEINLTNNRYEDIYALESYIEIIKAKNNRADFARASYLYGMALVGMGNMEEGIKHLSNARNEDPWNIRYKVGAIYVLAKCGEWEKAIDSVIELSKDEGVEVELTINDFADVGVVFGKLGLHFLEKNLMEAVDLCNEILEFIIQTKISNKHEIEKVNQWMNRTGKALKEIING